MLPEARWPWPCGCVSTLLVVVNKHRKICSTTSLIRTCCRSCSNSLSCQWHPVAPSGTQWHPVAPSGTQWHPVAPSGTQWHPVAPSGTQWHPVAPSGTLQHRESLMEIIGFSVFCHLHSLLLVSCLDYVDCKCASRSQNHFRSHWVFTLQYGSFNRRLV